MNIIDIDDHLTAAAQITTGTQLDRFPPLIVYRCLESSSGTQMLAAAARSLMKSKTPATGEVLAIPRRTFGVRPVEVLSPTSRTVLTALVRLLAESLVEPSRAKGAWKEHRDFGRTGAHSHVVELDFASCYELIDHQDLRRELLVRTFDIDTVDALSALLTGVGHRGRGLPQMLEPSDRLADTYLSVLDRQLARTGYNVNRFADDFRVLADDWETANDIVDLAAEGGRALGLVLSASKTTVWLTEKLDAYEEAPVQVLAHYTAHAFEDLEEWVQGEEGPYGHFIEALPPERADALRAAYWRLLHDWMTKFRAARHDGHRQEGRLAGHIAPGLAALVEHSEGLPKDLLDDLVFDDPTRLESVCRYVLARHREGQKMEARRALERLASVRRQGPWAKLWLLHLAEEFGVGSRSIPRPVRDWLPLQLSDDHELVRAQAAWVLACRGALANEHLEKVYPRATEVSAPALAAASARQNAAARERRLPLLNHKLVEAIRDDGMLNQEAHKWGA